MKKIISLILVCILLCGLSLTVTASENSNSTAAEELLNKGFPQNVINTMDAATIERVYQKMQADNVVEVNSNQETYFISFPSDSPEGVFTRDAIPSSRLRIVANTMNFANSSGKITGCDIMLSYDWLVSPGSRSTDAVTLGWDPGLFTYSGYMSGNNKVTNISTGGEDYYNFISSAALANTGGIGWYAKLQSPNISPKIQANPGGSAYVSFMPARTFYSNSGITSNFQIQYTHNKLGLSIGLSYGVVGVSVDCLGGTDTASKTMVYRSNIINEF